MQRVYWLMLLIFLVIGSAISVIYVKHESRVLFADLRQIQKKQDEQLIFWSVLQLQNSTLMTQSNVESMARKKLNMIIPEQVQIVTVASHD